MSTDTVLKDGTDGLETVAKQHRLILGGYQGSWQPYAAPIFADDKYETRELVTRSQAEAIITAKDEKIKFLLEKQMWGFYEDEYPIYTDAKNAHPELGSVVTVDELNGLVRTIKEIKAENATLTAQIKELLDTSKQMIGNWRNRAETAEAKLETYHEEYENRKEGYEKTIDSLEEKLAAAEKDRDDWKTLYIKYRRIG